MKHWSGETNWQALGDVVARLKAKVCAAIAVGDEFEAELSHDELTAAEWRMHQAERLKDKARQRANAPGHERQQKRTGDE